MPWKPRRDDWWETPRGRLQLIQHQDIIARYKSGLTTAAIGDTLGLSAERVRQVLLQHDVPRRDCRFGRNNPEVVFIRKNAQPSIDSVSAVE